jgi:hypothetical protein
VKVARAARVLAFATAIAVALVLGNTAARGAHSVRSSQAAEETALDQPLTLPRAPVALKPGRYVTSVFKPKLTFAIGPGWRVLSPEDARFVTLLKGNVLFAILRPARVIDPAGAYVQGNVPQKALLPLPRDLISWLAKHPRLVTSAPRDIRLSGMQARRVEATVSSGYAWRGCRAKCLLLFATRPDFLVYATVDDKMRLDIATVGGQTVIVTTLTSRRAFAQSVGQGQKVTDTVRFVG